MWVHNGACPPQALPCGTAGPLKANIFFLVQIASLQVGCSFLFHVISSSSLGILLCNGHWKFHIWPPAAICCENNQGFNVTNISYSPLGLAQGKSSVGTAVLLYLLGPVQLSVYPHGRETSQCLQRDGQTEKKHPALSTLSIYITCELSHGDFGPSGW